MSSRDIDRDRRRSRRAVAKRVAVLGAEARHLLLLSLISRATAILNDKAFLDVAKAHGIDSAPKLLFATHPENSENTLIEAFSSTVLDFTVCWKFFLPLLSHKAFIDFLNQAYPDFIIDMKDMFISLVMKGPFLTERNIPLTSKLFH